MSNVFRWRPLDPEFVRDPYQMYKSLRESDPIHLAQTGEYIVTRYDDVRRILKSTSFASGNRLDWLKRGITYFTSKDEDLRSIYDAMNSFILMLNDEQHRRVRNFVTQAWDDHQVDGIIEHTIAALLGTISDGEPDVVGLYAQPLPVYTISAILGIPVTDCQRLIELGVTMTKTLDLYISLKDMVAINAAAAGFIAFFREQIRLKSDRPDCGLLNKLIHKNRRENCGLSEEELISIAIFLFTAGEETSAGLIANAILNLLRHPYQLQLARAEPRLYESAIEETLRYDSVVQLLGRITREEISIGDKVIPRDATVTLVVAAANRDDRVFERADEFLIDRKPNRHLSFGTGVHYCLGDWLARRQSHLAVKAFFERYPQAALPEQELAWYKNIAIRRLRSLCVKVHA
jgi:cytochrome P450